MIFNFGIFAKKKTIQNVEESVSEPITDLQPKHHSMALPI